MKISGLLACPSCDLLLRVSEIAKGAKAHCPRCDDLLFRAQSINCLHTLALSLTGFFLLFPANLLPIIGIKVLGKSHESTLWGGVISLFHEGMWLVAFLVFLSSICFPILNIVLTLVLSASLHFRWRCAYLPLCMRCLQAIEEWAMLEVYMLGIIVACVKLASMADLKFGFGLSAYVLLLLVSVLLAYTFNARHLWQQIGQLNGNEKS